MIFGVSLQMKEILYASIKVDAPVFLLNTTENVLFGLFKADSVPGERLDPDAFLRRKGHAGTSNAHSECMFPIQIRVGVIFDAPPIMGQDPEVCNSYFIHNCCFALYLFFPS